MNGYEEEQMKCNQKLKALVQNESIYIQGFINSLSKSTIKTRQQYAKFVIQFLDTLKKDPLALNYDDYNNYIGNLQFKDNGEMYTPSYRIQIYSALKKFSKYMYVSKKSPEHYMLYIERPASSELQKTIKKREEAFYTENEIMKIYRYIDRDINSGDPQKRLYGIRDKAIIKLFLNTGIRCTELINLNVNDIDVKEKRIDIVAKGAKPRPIYTSEEVLSIIQLWLNEKNKLFPETKEAAPLFLTRYNERFTSQSMNKLVKKRTSVIPNKEFSPHKLRATYGTELYKKTGDIYLVQECMGHKSPKTTEIYTRDKKYSTKKASEILASIF